MAVLLLCEKACISKLGDVTLKIIPIIKVFKLLNPSIKLDKIA